MTKCQITLNPTKKREFPKGLALSHFQGGTVKNTLLDSPKLFLKASMIAKMRWTLSQMLSAIRMLLKQLRISLLQKRKYSSLTQKFPETQIFPECDQLSRKC